MRLLNGLDDIIAPLSEYERFLLELSLSQQEMAAGRSLTLAQRQRLTRAFLVTPLQSTRTSLQKSRRRGT